MAVIHANIHHGTIRPFYRQMMTPPTTLGGTLMSQASDHFPSFNASAKPLLMLEEDLTIADATDAFLAAWSLVRDDIVGHSVFEVFPNSRAQEARGEGSDAGLLPIQELFDRAPGFICVT
ncbi:MAG TPA: hypothetical protein VGE12_14225, partial [Noviherbaspirillum sp.]